MPLYDHLNSCQLMTNTHVNNISFERQVKFSLPPDFQMNMSCVQREMKNEP